eukprot:TRINITY_DN6779_c1_g1_i1.p1 TRINITY_DN6779_c1_g1~~TRINITY_DN6779_c1_g1_i1.p1  ORF type:complete len:839 (+),score=111.37 TRINITY_DN6779_c1_g1_i1:63-2579(+)
MARSSTPDAEFYGRPDMQDWTGPWHAKSAPASATKAKMLQRSGCLQLSPTDLSRRMFQSGLTPFSTPARAGRMSWGLSMQLDHTWTFWAGQWCPAFALEAVGSFNSMKDFWALFDNLPLNELGEGRSLHMFKGGIRPTWEDEQNRNGGQLRVVFDREAARRPWLNLTLHLVGELFEGASKICGASVTVKEYGTCISLWLDSRDAALRDMVSNQFADVVESSKEPVFKTHKPDSAGRARSQSLGTDPGTPAARLRDPVSAAKVTQPRRRTNSAPSPQFRERLLNWQEEETPIAQSTLAHATCGFLFNEADYSSPVQEHAYAGFCSPSPAAKTGVFCAEQSKRAARAGVRSLNPALVSGPDAKATNAAVAAAQVAGTPHPVRRTSDGSVQVPRRRSYSDSHRRLVLPTGVTSTRIGASGMRTPNRDGVRRRSQPQPHRVRLFATQSPSGSPSSLKDNAVSPTTKTPQAWADAWDPPQRTPRDADSSSPRPDWTQQARWSRRDGESPKQYKLFANSTGGVPIPPLPVQNDLATLPGVIPGASNQPALQSDPQASRTADAYNEWQVHQRARDACGTTQQVRRGAGDAHGKSASPAFMHKGYLYPPGLNRKQRRAIIFNPDQLRPGDVPQGQWVGEEVPDGPVSEEEYAQLRAGQKIARTGPLGSDSPPPSNTVSPPLDPVGSPGRLMDPGVLRGDVLQPYPPMPPPMYGAGQSVVRVMVIKDPVARRPNVLPGPDSGFDPSLPKLKRLNPDAMSFTPQGSFDDAVLQGSFDEPPTLLNGVPFLPRGPSDEDRAGADATLRAAAGAGALLPLPCALPPAVEGAQGRGYSGPVGSQPVHTWQHA